MSDKVVAGDDVEIVELVTTEVVKATTTSTGKRVEIIETHLESLEKQSSSPHASHKEISALCKENKDIEKKIEKEREQEKESSTEVEEIETCEELVVLIENKDCATPLLSTHIRLLRFMLLTCFLPILLVFLST